MKARIFATLVLVLVSASPAYASEVTGTLTTGVQTGVEGTVIVAPTASPTAGTYTSAQSVSLAATGSSSIRYTTDGSTPTCSAGTVYSSAISVGSSLTLKAIACYSSNNASTVTSFAYTINISTGGGGGGSAPATPVVPATPAVPAVTQLAGCVPGSGDLFNTTNGQSCTVSATPATPAIPAVTTTTTTNQGQVLGAEVFNFLVDFGIGSRITDVMELQKILIAAGNLSISAPTGYFGPLTQAAVKKYQSAHNVITTGYVGPLTRGELNRGGLATSVDSRLDVSQASAIVGFLQAFGADQTIIERVRAILGL